MSGQLWAVNALGGFMYSDELSDILRMDLLPTVKFRQFCDAKDAIDKGLNHGEFFNWNVYSRVASGGGVLNESVEMPKTNFTVTQKQLTITEYGNSIPYTGKLDNLSKQPVTEIIHKVLKVDAKETLDGAAHAQFLRTLLKAAPASGTSTTALEVVENGTITATQNVTFRIEHVKLVSDLMKERNIPAYINDDYYAIGWPSTFRAMKNGLETLRQYVETGFRYIANGEIGRYEGMRFVEQTHVAKGGARDARLAGTWNFRTADAWNNAGTNYCDWIFFFGEDTVAEALAIPEEIRGKIPTDYGRSRGIAWYYLGGFGIVHGDTAADVKNARIVHWDSAA